MSNQYWNQAITTILNTGGASFDQYRKVIGQLRDIYGEPIGCGSYRLIFNDHDQYVYKAPLSPDGERDNAIERNLWASHPLSHFAECELDYDYNPPVLVMEKLKNTIRLDSGVSHDIIDKQDSTDPHWIANIDGAQVGYNHLGRLQAYDYSRDAAGNQFESRAKKILREVD
jgi:hypothetical protein